MLKKRVIMYYCVSGSHGDDVASLSTFLTERVLAHHRPSIVALVDLSQDVNQLTRLAQNDNFRDWLVSMPGRAFAD